MRRQKKETKMLKLNHLGRLHNQVLKRLKSTLVIVEHDNQKVTPVTLNAITAAKKIPKNESITCIVAGTNCAKIAEDVAKVEGVKKVLVVDDGSLKGFLPEVLAPIVVNSQKQFNFSHIAAGSSAFGKNLLPRVAALLDIQPISDIIGINDEQTFVRTIYAGNAIQTIKVTLISINYYQYKGIKLLI